MDKLKNKHNKIKKVFLTTIFLLLAVGGMFVGSFLFWIMQTWQSVTMEEIMFHINAPIQGASSELIWNAVLMWGIPTIVVLVLAIIVLVKMNGKARKNMMIRMMMAGVVIAASMIIMAMSRYDVAAYFQENQAGSDFIEENYVDARQVSLEFPKKKRNLIYIFLESMENTNASFEEGGQFEKSLIPELVALANENVNFSATDKLGGGVTTGGAGWTMGAMFAQTTGLPLKMLKDKTTGYEQDIFFPEVTSIGDILAEQNYNQALMVGSDSTFGGRKSYFREHGQYEIYDFYSAKEEGKIPNEYKVFWGYEDKKLFEYAKEKITALSQEEEPFNFTMLTVDTHFEDGFLCDLCDDEFGDDAYANVYACSSRQVTEFVTWIQEQPFYEDTAVVLAGDHLSMDNDFHQEVPRPEDRQVYNAFINSAVEPKMEKNRKFTTLDFFPTTLASMGVKIPGDRLAMGTNLFSNEETLIDKYDLETINKGIMGDSDFMDKLSEGLVPVGRLVSVDDELKYEKVDGTFATDEWIIDLNWLHYFDENGRLEVYKDLDKVVKTLIPGGELCKGERGWQYKNEDGSFAKDETKIVEDVVYYFDQDGYLTEIEKINKE